jgi:hypothetical protein
LNNFADKFKNIYSNELIPIMNETEMKHLSELKKINVESNVLIESTNMRYKNEFNLVLKTGIDNFKECILKTETILKENFSGELNKLIESMSLKIGSALKDEKNYLWLEKISKSNEEFFKELSNSYRQNSFENINNFEINVKKVNDSLDKLNHSIGALEMKLNKFDSDILYRDSVRADKIV